MRRLYRNLLFILLIFWASGSLFGQILGFRLAPGKSRVEIPFELHNNLIVIPVVLNNAIPLKFILDTGVRTAILTEKSISDLLQIEYARKFSIIGAGGGDTVDAYIAHDISLQLPGVYGKGQAIMILEKDYLHLRNSLGVDVHGILGYEIFGRFVVKIDYSNKKIILTEPANFVPPRKGKSFPILVEDTKPYVFRDLRLNDSTVFKAKLMIDTGASHSLLLDPGSNDCIVMPDSLIDGKLGRGLTGDIMGYIGRIRKIEFDDLEFKNVIASFPDPVGYESIRNTTNRNGTIGAGILSRFFVTFDYMNERIYLQKNRRYRTPFEYNMSGIDIQATGLGYSEFIINYVREDSPAAAADLKVGDKILTVNGHMTKDLKLGEVFNFLSSRDGKTIRLKIERDGIKMKRKFHLQRLI